MPKRGEKLSEETKQKISKNNSRYWLGKKRSRETIEKFRNSHIGNVREKSGNWRGLHQSNY